MIISSKLILARFDALTVLPLLLLYAISARFRMAAEVRGYLVQIAADSISQERAATLLMRYGVDITYEQAGCLLVSARG
jgi:hypothetical protein